VVTALIEPSLTNPADIALVTALVVSEEHRGGGFGRRLLEAVDAWGRARGCLKFVVTTANHRAGAHQFYERLGWEWTGRRYSRFRIEN
jgi:GNAT superfamily N-acetyltransferase